MTDQQKSIVPNSAAPFSDAYIDICFQAWYLAGRTVSYARTIEILPPDDTGRKPERETLIKWRKKFDWDLRADDLDARALQISDDFLVKKKAEMLRVQAQAASEIAEKALNTLMEKGFDTSAAAVNAYFRATEEQRLTNGISDMMIKMSKMNDGDLKEKIAQLLERANENNQIIDGDTTDLPEDTPE